MPSWFLPLIWSLLEGIFWTLLFFVPLGVVLWSLFRVKKAYEQEAKIPFTDVLLRPPGESSRQVAEKKFEAAMENFLVLIVCSLVMGVVVALSPAKQRPLIAPGFGIATIVAAWVFGRKILHDVSDYRKYQLGFKGERIVGEELNQLLTKGYRVFHDVQFDGYNVDHVAVGSAGVFVIETKARRKWKVRELKHPAHVVFFDGKFLTWPSGKSDRFGLEQTERNARTVSQWLTEATGETVTCRGILTLPGWWIERTIKSAPTVLVLSSKNLHRYFPTKSTRPISSAQVRRIVYHLSERCKLRNAAQE